MHLARNEFHNQETLTSEKTVQTIFHVF